jgi:hypothetical protein
VIHRADTVVADTGVSPREFPMALRATKLDENDRD